MVQDSSFIATFVVGLGLSFLFGAAANRLRISIIVGYLLAGVVVGPFTPGFIADQRITPQLAEIGVVLLMFGVGLHFSPRDLLAVRRIAIPGAILQVLGSVVLGILVARGLGWRLAEGVTFGLALSIASTVVLMRSLQEHRVLETDRGRIAAGWLVVQDLLMVLALILIPTLAPLAGGQGEPDWQGIAIDLALTLGKVTAFIALMLVVGRRVIPLLLHYVAHTGSRELFRLAVLAVALGVAFGAAELFSVSFALGAFFAGTVLSESELSQRAAEESLPMRDAFAALFFMSVGMLFDPTVILREPLALVGTLLVVLVGNAGLAFFIIRGLGQSAGTALMVAAGLAQIGEFSFILADLGIGLKLLPERARDLVLGTSILSILANPAVLILADRLRRAWEGEPEEARQSGQPERPRRAIAPTRLSGHAVLVGYGRVGRAIAEGLLDKAWPFFVIEESPAAVASLHERGIEAVAGNGASDELLAAANLAQARLLFVAIPQAFEAGQIVEQARSGNPRLEIVARAHFDAEAEHLSRLGADTVIMGEREIARGMLAEASALGVPAPPRRPERSAS
jgi:CPA2 family monovalent cation:H+ antiporter-2